MADTEDRTEPATSRRRDDARKKGQVAKSQEIGSAFVLLTGFLILAIYGPAMYQYMAGFMKYVFAPEFIANFELNDTSVGFFFMSMFNYTARILAPMVIIIAVVGVFFNLVQVGIKLSAGPLAPNLSKLNPMSGLKRIFSFRSITELIKSVIKISAVGIIGYGHLKAAIPEFNKLQTMPLSAGMAFVASSTFILAMKLCLVLIILAILDMIYQRYDFEKSIKMTKQEVKDEMKQREGDPLIRSKIRQRQREIAFRRMMAEVPKADVVITNPVHIAVAISYVAEQMHAPKVVAMGAGVIAERIKEIARENEVPIMEDKPLAQTLFKMCDVGDFIPPAMFKAIAEILAYVYRLGQKKHKFGI